MRVAIAGSSGLIGTALCTALEADGHEAIPIVRAGTSAAGTPGTITWNIPGGKIETDKLEGLDAIVNLAGEPIANRRWSTKQRAKILDSRVDGTTLISNAIAELENPPKVFLSGSAMGIYGDPGDAETDEASPHGEGFLVDVVEAWESATIAAELAGIRVVHLRTGIVISAAGGVLKRLLPIYKLGLGGPLGSGQQWMSWIDIADHVAAMIHLIDSDVEGPVNLVSPTPVRNEKFNKAMASAVSRPAFFRVPAFAPRVALGQELADGLLFDSLRIIPTVLLKSGFEFTHTTLEDSLKTHT